jgi:hypothetical protein
MVCWIVANAVESSHTSASSASSRLAKPQPAKSARCRPGQAGRGGWRRGVARQGGHREKTGGAYGGGKEDLEERASVENRRQVADEIGEPGGRARLGAEVRAGDPAPQMRGQAHGQQPRGRADQDGGGQRDGAVRAQREQRGKSAAQKRQLQQTPRRLARQEQCRREADGEARETHARHRLIHQRGLPAALADEADEAVLREEQKIDIGRHDGDQGAGGGPRVGGAVRHRCFPATYCAGCKFGEQRASRR